MGCFCLGCFCLGISAYFCVFLRIAWVFLRISADFRVLIGVFLLGCFCGFLRISADFLSLAILRKNVHTCKRKPKPKPKTKAKGILVCQTSVNTHLSVELETVRGFCIAERPFSVIVVNPKDSPYGRIFTLIHELVHIALGESVIQNTNFEEANSPNLDPIEVFCNQVAAEVLVSENELLEIVNLETLQEDLSKTAKFFHVSPEVIMRRLLTLGMISRRNYQIYRSRQLAKYRDAPGRSGGATPYHNRLLNTAGEHFARTAFTAYYEQKITRAELASVLSNSDTKHLPKIESAIFV